METTTTENNTLINIEMQPEYLDLQTNNLETQPNKRRKKKSIVWEHFTIENVGADCRRACCKQCKQSFAYSTGSKVAGTSHLKRHIAKGGCRVFLRNHEHEPDPDPSNMGANPVAPVKDTPKRRYRTTSTPHGGFNPDRCRHELARMVILHDYPLHMVEHPGFLAFVHNLQPGFHMGHVGEVQADCLATFFQEKHTIRKIIQQTPGRVSLALDLWNSHHTTGYVFVTAQFLDSEWRLHRKLLNVVVEPYPESDSAFAHALSSCLSDWNMEGRLFSLTTNNAVSQLGVNSLRALLSEKNPNILSGQLLQNCLALSLTTIAHETLTACQKTVTKVRDCVKYVKTSEPLEEKFLALNTEKTLALDDQTHWNTTYEMLLAASEAKEVFSCLDYKKVPNGEEWKFVNNLCVYLKLLFETANLLALSTVPTTNLFFHEAWKIQLELARAASSDDLAVTRLTKPMQERFNEYWKSACLVLAVAVVMDPRFKMKLVEFSFTKLYGDEAGDYIKIVDEGIHELFLGYVTLAFVEEANGEPGVGPGSGLTNGLGLTDFDVYIMESTSQQAKSELDQYLEESLLPRVHEFDVMGWWKLNRAKYPTLSKMARDVLTVQVSSVGPEAVFEVGAKEMDRYRCSLGAETVEALFCTKDWLRCEPEETMNALVKMEFPI